jgi:hypothetical protein
LIRLLTAGLALALLAGCSITYVAPPKPQKPLPLLTEPTLAPTQAPSRGAAAGNVDCSKTVGSTAGYTLFGAAAPDFNAGHPGAALLLRCATDGKVIVLQLDLSPAMTADQALVIARRQLPSDLKPVYDRSLLNCRDVQLQSAKLSAVLGTDDPDGVVNIELESALATNFKYDGSHVDTIVLHQQDELKQVQPCVRN